MASATKPTYHRRLFLMLIAFLWSIVLCFIGFQYLREKQYKQEFLSAQLQMYNRHLLEAVEGGESPEEYILKHTKPFEDLRVSVIALSGAVVRTAIPYSATLSALLKADWTFLGIMIAISIAVSVLAYFITHRLGETIERINEMEAEQEKTRLKRQLTNNINHELKTPVASIGVCLETLLSGINLSEEKRQELIERCYANNERLRRLLSDVSLITRMEDGNALIEREPVDITALIADIASELAIMPEGERLTLHTDITEPIIADAVLSPAGAGGRGARADDSFDADGLPLPGARRGSNASAGRRL